MKNTAIFPSPVAISDADNTCYALAKDRAMTLPQRHAIVIQCHAGILWLTIAGDAEDYFVYAGESITCRKDRTIVVEAMRDVARFQIFCLGQNESLLSASCSHAQINAHSRCANIF
jgi:Protein of unknown function (DUF2917)